MVCKVVFDQSIRTWLDCHAQAFTELGGVPAVVVPDNLKSAVVRAAFGAAESSTLNRSYRECARHFGFLVDPTPVREPKKKGKVESAVKYVKRSFFAPRSTELDARMLSRELTRWTREIAGERIHGTTRRRPLEVFVESEKAALLPLPASPFVPTIWREATVHEDAHICVERALYSVPWPLVGRQVLACVTEHSVAILHEDSRVATHARVVAGQRSTREEHLPPHRRDFRHRSRGYWEERAERMGAEVGQYVREVFDSDDALSQLHSVQRTVCYLEGYPRERAQAACARARFFASYGFAVIKGILDNSLDSQALPIIAEVAPAPEVLPRFARDLGSLLAMAGREVSHASH